MTKFHAHVWALIQRLQKHNIKHGGEATVTVKRAELQELLDAASFTLGYFIGAEMEREKKEEAK